MRCPHCGHDDTRVVDSRPADDGAAIRRRRSCEACGARFTTFERLEGRTLFVRKRDGRRTPFDRRKIISGLVAATKGRPVTYVVIEGVALEIESMVRSSVDPVGTDRIGEVVLARLREHDEVAYLRFASVYRGFDDVSDFVRELQLLESDGDPVAP